MRRQYDFILTSLKQAKVSEKRDTAYKNNTWVGPDVVSLIDNLSISALSRQVSHSFAIQFVVHLTFHCCELYAKEFSCSIGSQLSVAETMVRVFGLSTELIM